MAGLPGLLFGGGVAMRIRFFVVLCALVLALLPSMQAWADDGGGGHNRGDDGQGVRYLALGDSVPFGFNPLKNPNRARNFTGYPEIVGKRLDTAEVNASCTGEATGGFISLAGTDNVCRPYRAAFPLHVNYDTSQLDFALSYLRTHSQVELVTLTLGANDLFRLQKDCTFEPSTTPDPTCVAAGIPGVLGTMDANLRFIFAAIRATGYEGLLVGVTYYALDYNSPAGAILLNGPMQDALAAYGGIEASGFDAWRPTAIARGAGDSCKAGLLIRLRDGTCDVHPSPLGRDLLAGAVVNALPEDFDLSRD